MTETTLATHGADPAGDGVATLRRAAIGGFLGFCAELAQARRDFARRRGLRGLDRNQLRDLGVDRSAC